MEDAPSLNKTIIALMNKLGQIWKRFRTDSRAVNPDITEYFRGPAHYSPIAFTRNRPVIVWNDLESMRMIKEINS